MMTINIDKQKKALQDTLDRLETFLSNGDISLEEYYARIYPIEYELEYLNDLE